MSLGIMFYRVSMLPADLAGNPPTVTFNYETKHGDYKETFHPVSVKEIVGFLKDAYAVQQFFVPNERDGVVDIISTDQLRNLNSKCTWVLSHIGQDNFLTIARGTLPDKNLMKEHPLQADIDWYIEYLKETVKVIDNMPPLKPNQTYRYSYWY